MSFGVYIIVWLLHSKIVSQKVRFPPVICGAMNAPEHYYSDFDIIHLLAHVLPRVLPPVCDLTL